MQIFISSTKTVPTYPRSYFFDNNPPENSIFFSILFWAKSSLLKVRKSHKVSGSYHKAFRNNLNLNLPLAKRKRSSRGKGTKITIKSPKAKLPRHFNQFMKNSENKQDWLRSLLTSSYKVLTSLTGDTKITTRGYWYTHLCTTVSAKLFSDLGTIKTENEEWF